jgi:hypothetical protein
LPALVDSTVSLSFLLRKMVREVNCYNTICYKIVRFLGPQFCFPRAGWWWARRKGGNRRRAEGIAVTKELNDMHGLAVALYFAGAPGHFEGKEGRGRKGNRISFVRIEPTNTWMASEILIGELLKEL